MSERDGKPARGTPEGDDLSDRLRSLERRLGEERRATGQDETSEAPPQRTGYAQAMRLTADFVAGILVGGAIGWGVDRLFGTSPWGLAVFLLLGFAAGILSMLRSAGLVKPGPAGPDNIGDRM